MKVKDIFPVVILLVLISSAVCAEDDAFSRLLKAKTLKCHLGKGAFAEWKNGKVEIEISRWSKSPETSNSIFDSIDLKAGKARIIGNQGATDVIALATPTGLTFIEETPAGNINITTVFAKYNDASNDFTFVHSRHLMLFGEPLPSQYYGVCKSLE